jgi:RNA polymerase sigma-70 factor (ECF subfamily)
MTERGQQGEVRILTGRMAHGDESAFQEFFSAYYPRLLRYLLVVTRGQEEEAREALQSTLLRVVKHIRCFDTEAQFWGWLTVLARSAAVDEQRKRRRYDGLLARFFQNNSGPTAAADVESERELIRAVQSEIAALPMDERDLLIRKYESAESVREIAAVLGSSEKAVESRLTRVRKKLKEAVLARLQRNE